MSQKNLYFYSAYISLLFVYHLIVEDLVLAKNLFLLISCSMYQKRTNQKQSSWARKGKKFIPNFLEQIVNYLFILIDGIMEQINL